MKRKKPEGVVLVDFCEKWDSADHDEKMVMASDFGVTYDSAKHWRSESTDVVALPTKDSWYKMHVTSEELLGMRPAVNLDIVTFDIETSNLDADFSIMLSAVIKPFGCSPFVFRADAYPEWKTNRENDKGIVTAIADELRKHAIVICHFGQYFDIPYFRAKMFKHNLEPLPPMFAIDSWRIAKNNFKVSSRRLKNLAEYFQIGDKEPVEPALWMKAAYSGDKEAMDRIVAHNIRDCEVLEKLSAITFPLLKTIPRM